MNESTTTAKLTDEAVSMLPLEAGRAELLEEIMSTPVLSSPAPETQTPPSRRSRWLVPIAAAAAVAGIAAATLWGQGLLPDDSPSSIANQPGAQPGNRAVLDVAGWEVSATESGDDGYGEVNYEKGRSSFTITWYPADLYQEYVVDREHIVDPPAPGEPVTVLGVPGQLWSYSANDHTVIREVQDGFWIEFRGSRLDKAAYLGVLGQVSMVDRQGYEAALPEDFVTSDERAGAKAAMLAGITGVTGVQGPGGREVRVQSGDNDPYQLGAAVAGAYACAWLEAFENAVTHAQPDQAAEAARVLGTSRDWPVLNEMNERGDYPEVLWGYSDTVQSGEVPEGYREGLGC